MELNPKSRRRLRLQGWSFAILFLAAAGLLGFLSTRYHFQSDWTAGGRHTLSEATTQLLETLAGPVTVTAFAKNDEFSNIRRQITEFVARYQRYKPDLQLEFINPDLAPDKVRELGITLEGELVIEYAGRRENVGNLTEEALTNTLQRLARSSERRIVFLQGHGERRPGADANHDLSLWVRQLENKGFRFGELNLAATPEIPTDTSVLVVASPATTLFPGEVDLIRNWVEQGGNLLWLVEPDGLHGLDPLAELIGIRPLPGVVVDPTTELLQIDHPAFAVVADYPAHPVTENLAALTLFPQAVAFEVQAPEGWEAHPLLKTVSRSWSETSELQGVLTFDQGQDHPGPLLVGLTLARQLSMLDEGSPKPDQRIAVVGDGDFLSNTYLGNAANIELGNRLVNWLSHDDDFISIPAKTAPDNRLELTPAVAIGMAVGFLLVLPGGLLAAGIGIWVKRRKR